MKNISKLLILLLTFVCIICLSGCTNNGDLVELEKAIGDLQTNMNELQDEKDYLTEEIENLLAQIAELEKDNSTQQSIIYALRDSVQKAQEQLKEVNGKLDSMEAGINVQLADEYHLVVGDNFQLFYRSVVQAPDPYGYYIKLDGTKGHAYNRYYEFNPTEPGEYKLTLSVCDANGTVYGSDSTKLIVVEGQVLAQNNRPKNILCIGDSLTYNGVWVAQGMKKYIAAGGTKVNTIGKMTQTIDGVKVNYEGHGSWQWGSYINGFNGEASPFSYPGEKNGISFKKYANSLGYDRIDELYCLLTWNAIGGSFREFNFQDNLFSNAKILIDRFHEEFPAAKVTLIGIPKPSMNSGLGAYYEINYANGDNYAMTATVMNYNQFLEDWTKMDGYKNFMSYIDGMGQFDSEYNMPSESKPVNNQSSVTEPVGNAMGLHPSNNGYRQIGDAFFRALMRGNK